MMLFRPHRRGVLPRPGAGGEAYRPATSLRHRSLANRLRAAVGVCTALAFLLLPADRAIAMAVTTGSGASTIAPVVLRQSGTGLATLVAPQAPPFGPERRVKLARSVLLFSPADDDDRVDTGVYLLPVPLPWPPGVAQRRSWELDIPGDVPVFLLAAITPAARVFSAGTIIRVDGQAILEPEAYSVKAIALSDGAGPQEYGALALVLSGLSSGRHAVTVSCNGCAPGSGPWLGPVNGGQRTYILNVGLPRPRAGESVLPGTSGTPGTTGIPSGTTGIPSGTTGIPSGTTGAQGVPSVVPGIPGSPDAAGSAVWDKGRVPPGRGIVPVNTAHRGGTVLDQSFHSAALGRDMAYRIYLPPGYQSAPGEAVQISLSAETRAYPVLYLLHGLGGTYRQWENLGIADELDRQLEGRLGQEFIVVMPAGRDGYWVNHVDGGPRWGDYVANDLVRHIDATYLTVGRREARAIGGISMGGHGALQLTFTHPELFSVTGAHSPALRPRDQAPPFLGGQFAGQTASPGPSAYAARDPISLARSTPIGRPSALWIDMGAQDSWVGRATELHSVLAERRWSHQWSITPGGHDRAYWQRRLPEYVRFYREALAAAPRSTVSTGRGR